MLVIWSKSCSRCWGIGGGEWWGGLVGLVSLSLDSGDVGGGGIGWWWLLLVVMLLRGDVDAASLAEDDICIGGARRRSPG